MNPSVKCRDIMNRKVITVKTSTTARQAARIMSQHAVGSLIVVSRGKPVGIVTERDFVNRLVGKSKGSSAKVTEFMSSPVETASPEIDIVTASKLMNERNIRRLPLVEKGTLVGIVTSRDLHNYLFSHFDNLQKLVDVGKALVQQLGRKGPDG